MDDAAAIKRLAISEVLRRVGDLICYERCRAGTCKDGERCCAGGQCPTREIAGKEAEILLAPLWTPATDNAERQ